MDETEAGKALNIWPGVVATALVCGGMLAASAWAWDKVPDRIPVHFGLDGTADRWGAKWEGLLIMPGVVALIGLIMAVIPMIDPRRNNLASSGVFYYAVWYGELMVMSVAHAALIAAAMGFSANGGQIILIAVGALFVLLGNFMGKSRSNWFAGFRTPWTLSSEYSWQRTHRVTGWMFVAAGLATMAAAFFVSMLTAVVVLMASVGAAVFLGAYLSYIYWKIDPERREA